MYWAIMRTHIGYYVVDILVTLESTGRGSNHIILNADTLPEYTAKDGFTTSMHSGKILAVKYECKGIFVCIMCAYNVCMC